MISDNHIIHHDMCLLHRTIDQDNVPASASHRLPFLMVWRGKFVKIFTWLLAKSFMLLMTLMNCQCVLGCVVPQMLCVSMPASLNRCHYYHLLPNLLLPFLLTKLRKTSLSVYVTLTSSTLVYQFKTCVRCKLYINILAISSQVDTMVPFASPDM